MSVHSLRNIGFMFLDQEATCRQWQKLFTNYQPQRAGEILQLPYDDASITVTYYGRRYRLLCATGVMEKELEDDTWTAELYMNEALVLYHLLGDVQDAPALSGIWVPESSLDPVHVRSGNRMDPLLRDFASRLSGHPDQLQERALALGGVPYAKGDAGFEFYPFSFFPVRLVFWEADEDFPAQLQLLVDQNSTQYMHFEAVSFVLADLLTFLCSDYTESSAKVPPSAESD